MREGEQEITLCEGAHARAQDALERAGFHGEMAVLHTFGAANPGLAVAFGSALNSLDIETAGDLGPTGFIGSPDRLFALLRSDQGQHLTHALVGGGAVFPIVHTLAAQNGISLCDMMSDRLFGPYALRNGRDEPYALLQGVEAKILRAGGDAQLPVGMPGEVVVRDTHTDEMPIRTGTISAFERVPHRFRAPGLEGWLGYVESAVQVDDVAVHATDIATLLREHDEVLDARLTVLANGASAPLLQVETEAGDWIDDELAASFEALTGLLPTVQRVTPGQFANTGRAFAVQAA